MEEEEIKDEEAKVEDTGEEVKEERPEAEAGEEEKHLDKMTVLELREIAKGIPGVSGVTAMKKDQLLSIIKKHRGIEDEKPGKKKVIAKVALTVQELKHKIAVLKADKKSVIEKHDRKIATVLRRRINRLKKRIRKTEKAA
jgi:protein-arginine kinase activator protein McsA